MTDVTYDLPQDIGKGPRGIVRRWMMELKLAEGRDKDWHKTGNDTYDRYRGKNAKKNTFNILWANTETVAPSVYNSVPKPDVRRRYRDDDPVGKVVSELLGRDLEFCLETDEFDHALKMDVLDMLLPGRGISRVKYVPTMVKDGDPDDGTGAADPALETEESESVAWEQVVIEHVQWDKFRHGPGKTWQEVPWIAYEHRLTRAELIEKFGKDLGMSITMDDVADEDIKSDDELKQVFATCQVWEIWDKESREVIFISPGYKDGPLDTLDDPLSLEGFFDVPRPLYAIADSGSLTPIALYSQYLEQAKELDLLTKRISVITSGLKLRGIYDSTMSEIESLMKGDDNQMIAAQNVAAMYERGGLEKAITWMPIEQAAAVMVQLMQQREQCKQTIYELCGIPDIKRGASDPNETLGAQEIKVQFSGERISNMQREVQRYIRDLVRLMGEVIAEHFSPETLTGMANMEIPTEQDWQMQLMQYQQQVQPGQQPPPPPQKPITLEQVMAVMKDDLKRCYKIDIETDSTIAASLQEDMAGLENVLTGISKFMETAAPAVQSGVLPFEAAKEIVMTICRRAKLGNAVEDAMDKMTAPPPPNPAQNPDAIKAQTEMAKIQAQTQSDEADRQHEAQLEQFKAQLADQQSQREMAMKQQADEAQAQRDMAMEQWKQQQQAAQVQHQNELEAQREMQRQQLEAADRERQAMLDAAAEQRKLDQERFLAQLEDERERWKAQLQAETAIAVAEMSAKTTLASAQLSAAKTEAIN